MLVLKMQNLSTGKEETFTDPKLIQLVNDELKNWIEDSKKSVQNVDYSNLSELVVLFGLGYEWENHRQSEEKVLQYVAGMGTDLYHAIRFVQSNSTYPDDIILKMNVDYAPYKIKVGLSVEVFEDTQN